MAVKGAGMKRIKEKRCVQRREEERRLRNHRVRRAEREVECIYVCMLSV